MARNVAGLVSLSRWENREYSALMQVNMGCSVPGVWEEQQVASDRIMTVDYCGVV